MERFAGRFSLVRELGRGGMGEVWLALDRTSGTECALKRLDLHLPLAARDSLRREFETLSRVRHPSIVAVHELGFSAEGRGYITMEYVPGVPADVALRGLGAEALSGVVFRLMEGLEAVHGAGLVHGDMKPSNLLVIPGGENGSAPVAVKLLDFGLSALLGRDREGHRGTPGYAAPEVVQGASLSVASDLYSLGITMCVLAIESLGPASGGPPVSTPTDAVAAALLLAELDAPAVFQEWVPRLLSPEPDARPQSVASVRVALEHSLSPGHRSLDARVEAVEFVGRGREWSRLEKWLEGENEPALMILEGESGIGKSSLLSALAARLTLAGRTVVSIACSTGGGTGEIGRRLLLRLAAAAEAAGASDAVSSERCRRIESMHDWGMAQLVEWSEAGQAWAAGLMAHNRAVVLLDDIDQLDGPSLALIRRMVATAVPGMRWLWSVAPGRALEGTPEALLIQAGWAERLPLGPLELAESRTLLGARLRITAPVALSEFVWERCGGHPGMSVEVLRRVIAAGALRESETGVLLMREALDQVRIPHDFLTACLQRLEARDADASRAARVLAVWEAPLAPGALSHFGVGSPEHAVLELRVAGLIGHDDEGRVTLQPPALVSALIERMTPEERSVIAHLALEMPDLSHEQEFRLWRSAGEPARALEAAESSFGRQPDADLALKAAALAEAAGDPSACTLWSGRAGHWLFSRGRHREAIPWLERAIAGEAPRESRESWIPDLATSYLRTGAYEPLAVFAKRMLAEDLGPVCRVTLTLVVAGRSLDLGELQQVEQLLAEGERLAEESGLDAALGFAAMIRSFTDQRSQLGGGQAIPAAERAIFYFERVGDVRGRLRAVGGYVNALWAAQRSQEAQPLLEEAIREARELDFRVVLNELLNARQACCAQAGDWRGALECADDALRLCVEEGWPGYVAHQMSSLTLMHALMGDSKAAFRWGKRALHLSRTYAKHYPQFIWRAIGLAARNSGRRRLAGRAFRRSARLGERGGTPLLNLWVCLEHGTMHSWQGHWAEALAVWRSALSEHPASDTLEGVLLHIQCARAQLRLGHDASESERLRAQVEPWLSARAQPLALAHAHQMDAELHLHAGRVEAAIAAAAECLAAFDRLPSPADSAHAALAFGRIGHRSPIGPRLPLIEWLERSAAGFRRLGDATRLTQALELALQCHRLYGATPRSALRDRELLQRVRELVGSMSDFDELSRAAMRLAVGELDAERGVLLLAPEGSDDEADLEPVVEHGAVDAETRGNALGYSRKAVRMMRESGQALLILDAPTELEGHSRSAVELGLRSILCVPLLIEGRLIGAVYLDDRRRSQAFGQVERDQLVGFASLLAVAIRSGRGQDATQRENAQLLDENLVLRREVGKRFHPANFIGSSPAMQRTLSVVERAAKSERTVLLTGENGTGKELVARMIHQSGPRATKPFIEVNCGAIVGELMVSELFGIEDRVATGVNRRPGLFRAAQGGTLFLDEIGEMSMAGQVALLRVLSERTVVPVGSITPVPVDVRVIAATNRDLVRQIAEGEFRRDLFFRLNVIPIEVPPLRERRADIPSLAQHFVAMIAAQDKRKVPTLSRELLDALMRSNWEGNVRELENYIERLMTLQSEPVLVPDPLPLDLQRRAGLEWEVRRGRGLPQLVDDLERRQVVEALERHDWHQSRAAQDLGLTEQSLRYRIRKYGLERPARTARGR